MYKTYWIYIVECNDNSYYTGVTNNLDRRIWEHNNDEDENHYTFSRRPVKLLYCEDYYDVNSAIDREKQIKGWSRRKKEALMKGDFNKLKKYSKRKVPNNYKKKTLKDYFNKEEL